MRIHPISTGRRVLRWFILLAIVVAAGYGFPRWRTQIVSFARSRLSPEVAGKQPVQRPPVSAMVATARRGDLPIYLDAPGTVTALNTGFTCTWIALDSGAEAGAEPGILVEWRSRVRNQAKKFNDDIRGSGRRMPLAVPVPGLSL